MTLGCPRVGLAARLDMEDEGEGEIANIVFGSSNWVHLDEQETLGNRVLGQEAVMASSTLDMLNLKCPKDKQMLDFGALKLIFFTQKNGESFGFKELTCVNRNGKAE